MREFGVVMFVVCKDGLRGRWEKTINAIDRKDAQGYMQSLYEGSTWEIQQFWGSCRVIGWHFAL